MPPSPSPDAAGWQLARRRVARWRMAAIGLWTAVVWVWATGLPWPGHWQLTTYLLGTGLIWLGADALTDLHYGRRFGVIADSPIGWARRRLKALLFAGVFLTVTVGPLPTAMAWWPRHWWLPMTLWLAAAWMTWTTLIPGLVLSRLITIRPLPAGPVAEALAELSQRVGRPLPIAVWALTAGSSSVQAVVVGLGPTQRILLTDTLLAELTPAEVTAVVAHELSHLERHDLLRRGTVLTLGLGAVLATAAGVTTGSAWDLPVLVLATVAVVSGYFRYLRHLELLADRRAVVLTGNGHAYGQTLQKIARINGDTATSGRLLSQLWEAHPGLTHRITKLGLDR